MATGRRSGHHLTRVGGAWWSGIAVALRSLHKGSLIHGRTDTPLFPILENIANKSVETAFLAQTEPRFVLSDPKLVLLCVKFYSPIFVKK